MNTRQSAVFLCLASFASFWQFPCKVNASETSSSQEAIVFEVKEAVFLAAQGDRSKLRALPVQGDSLVAFIEPFTRDSNDRVRDAALDVVRTTQSSNSVPILAGALHDSNRDIRRRVILSLNEFPTPLLAPYAEALIPALLDTATSHDDGADKAILVLGRIGDARAIAEIKKIRQDAAGATKKSSALAKAMNRSALMALVKLGDGDSQKEVSALLSTDTVESRVEGIVITEYAGRSMADRLVPLLDDTREALDISPSMQGDYFLRVCDLAATALRRILDPSREVRNGLRYSSEKLQKLKRSLTNPQSSLGSTGGLGIEKLW